ncbi:MAG: glycosyltransferase family 1 protein [Candidatus Lokiarchaeota archaeon]|nr:glycosyltransferase family 1 protein [Candidatus Lokiarchaeota archaeon]
MRIVMVINQRLHVENAIKTHVFELFSNLAKMSEISLIMPRPTIEIPKRENIFVYAKYKIPIPFFNLLFLQIEQFCFLFKFCIQKKPNIIYSRFSYFSFATPIISRLFDIPLIIEINGILTDELKITRRSRIKYRISKFFLKLSELVNYSIAKKIVAVTPGIQNYIQMNYNYKHDDIEIIPNGVNSDLFKPIEPIVAKNCIGLEERKRYIGFTGNLAGWQGLESLIQAVPKILKVYPNVHFIIVGEGQLKQDLIDLTEQLQISDKITFTGAVPYEKVPYYINACEICVVFKKSIQSGYSPLKLFEYLSCGRPVVASNVPGFEIIEDFDAGLLAESDNIEDLSSKIITLLENDLLRSKMGKNGRELVINEYTWEASAKKIIRIGHQIIK